MIIGAYQFPLSGNVRQNKEHISQAVNEAAKQHVRLLLLPECALTGYPKDDPKTIGEIDFMQVSLAMSELELLSSKHSLYIICGAVERDDDVCYNSALLFAPNQTVRTLYRKRALWGWDLDHFKMGKEDSGIVVIDGFRIGVRICYEIRFPEFFRELYRHQADCAAVLFCDESDEDLPERYDLIRAHLRTRAVENVIPLVCVNTSAQYQSAPSAAIDEDGNIIVELARHKEGLLLYDLKKRQELSFGATGRKLVSDRLTKEY